MTTLDPITYNRIRPLKNQIRTNKLDLRYFITITYWYRNTDYYSVVEDNKLLKNHIKDFFGSMGMIFFSILILNLTIFKDSTVTLF